MFGCRDDDLQQVQQNFGKQARKVWDFLFDSPTGRKAIELYDMIREKTREIIETYLKGVLKETKKDD